MFVSASKCAYQPSVESDGLDETFQSLAAISDAIRLDVILASVPVNAKRLIVIPHSFLCAVPFSALPFSATKQSPKINSAPTYLLDKFALGVVCVQSMKMLQWCEDRAPNLRFAPIIQGLALHKQSIMKQSSDGNEASRLDAEYSYLRKSLSKLSVEHQVIVSLYCLLLERRGILVLSVTPPGPNQCSTVFRALSRSLGICMWTNLWRPKTKRMRSQKRAHI
jgi:hypothetical protein